MIDGGLGDGRAEQLLSALAKDEGDEPFAWIAFRDRRHNQGPLAEPTQEALEASLKPVLSQGWVLVRFLDPRRPA